MQGKGYDLGFQKVWLELEEISLFLFDFMIQGYIEGFEFWVQIFSESYLSYIIF